jgi:hypothetical protein
MDQHDLHALHDRSPAELDISDRPEAKQSYQKPAQTRQVCH